jgi:transcriptional regulator with XRE-family HTH domain
MKLDTAKGLKIARIISGLKQAEVAAEVGISVNYLSLLENGHNRPSLDLLERFSEVYNASVSILLHESRNKI